jgi:hypothetical protein
VGCDDNVLRELKDSLHQVVNDSSKASASISRED